MNHEQPLYAKDLADKIAGYAKIRLCVSPNGDTSYSDWLVHERDRHLIVNALRFFHEKAMSGEVASVLGGYTAPAGDGTRPTLPKTGSGVTNKR